MYDLDDMTPEEFFMASTLAMEIIDMEDSQDDDSFDDDLSDCGSDDDWF